MSGVQIAVLLLTAAFGTAMVFLRDPFEQLIAGAIQGLSMVLLFLVWMAPDVALSQALVGGMPYPVMVLLALARAERRESREETR